MTLPELTDADIAERIQHSNRCRVPYCDDQRRPGGRICWEHHDELGRILDPDYRGERKAERAPSIPQMWINLDPTPAKVGGGGGRPPGFGSAPPLNLDAVVLRDRRSAPGPVVEFWHELVPGTNRPNVDRPYFEDVAPIRSVEATLAPIADAVWHARGYDDMWTRLGFPGPPPRRGVVEDCRWLRAHLDDLTADDEAGLIYSNLVDLHHQLRVAAGEPPDKPVATCTGWVEDRITRERVTCGAPLFMPPPDPGVETGPAQPPSLDKRKAVIRCGRCDRPYSYLMLLRQQIGEERKAS